MKEKNKSKLEVAFEISFIMILCFATLLTTMLMKGAAVVGSAEAGGMNYTIEFWSFLGTFSLLAVYLIFVISHSKKELKKMIEELYKDK